MTKDCCKTKKCGGGGAQDKACAAAAQPPSCCDSDSGKKCSVEKEPCCSSKKHEGVAAATITSGVGGVGGVGHSCCGSGVGGKAVGHHDHNTAEVDSDENNSNRLCLAVIRENGVDVVIFDAEGVPRTFRTTGADLQKLCFRSHGYDDMLTPCFDETGKHGAPEESCFCGIDTPHLHAHVRDPKMCDNATADDDKAKFSSDKIGYLASQVLHPTRNDKEDNIPLIHIPVSESMPNMCNFQEALRASTSNNGSDASLCHRPGSRRVHQVQHDDHVDYLVHNAEADQLHLEHACDTCGSNDVHGKFHAVGKRRLSSVQLHFFSVSHRPFNLLDCLTDIFELSSDRVNAVENILPHKSTTETLHHHHATTAMATPTKTADQKKMNAVRSTFKCTQICCASEVPMIHAVLQPVKGIDNIRINVPLKQVLIDHDPGSVTAAELRAAMHQFGCSVMRDGGASVAKRTTGRSQFYVQNICCASEIPAILRIVEPLAGVKNVSINTTTKTVYVDHELDTLTATQICAALNAQGFGAQVRVDAGDAAAHASSARSTFVKSTLTISNDVTDPDTETLTTFLQAFVDSSQLEAFVVDVPTKSIFVVHNPFSLTAERIAKLVSERTQLEAIVSLDGADPAIWTFPHDLQQDCIDATEDLHLDEGFTYPRVTVMISGLLWIISMLSLIGGPWEHLKWVALASVAFGVPPIAIKAFRTLRRYQFDTNCLMLFAAIGAVALQDFTEAAAVVFLFALSEWLEVRATSRARLALAAIVNLRPEKANLVHPTTHELLVVPAASVPVGALVSVMAGDKIPCDGVVVEGNSTVDESSLTGESRPVRKGPNDKVSGGTVNGGMSPLSVRTTATSENSAVSRLIRLVEEAQANRSETEKLVDRFAQVYTPMVVLAAILMCSIPWAFGAETGKEWTRNGLILIVVACPCALIISTPVSYVAGLAASAQKGVLIKGGATLEALGAIKHICFDKTGTLTNSEFALLQMKVLTEKLSRKEVFQYLSLMEERASHPVAQAILAAANNEKIVLPKKMVLQKHTIVNGEGVAGVIDGLEVHVGNERMFVRLGLLKEVPPSDREQVNEWKALGGTIGYMSVEGYGIVCAFCAADGVRAESAAVIKNLRKLGITVTMLTGDNEETALAIGNLVGLHPNEIKSKLLPEEKLDHVKSLSAGATKKSVIFSPCASKQLVMMCGDGVNDAPALAAADVGVAMGEGAALSMETSDMTLLDSNLEKIEYSIRMGRRVTAKIIQNVVFAVGVKFVVLGFAFAGMAELWAAIASDVGAMLIVTLNSMLLLPGRQTHAEAEDMKGDVEEANSRRARSTLTRVGSKTNREGVEPSQREGNACIQGCCESKAVMKAPVNDSCSKGCCDPTREGSTSEGTDAMQREGDVIKGCCDSKSVTKAPVASNKVCCDPTSVRSKTVSEGTRPSQREGDACIKGCCESKAVMTAPSSKESCSKGFCDPTRVGSISDSEGTETKQCEGDACIKGCCESKAVMKVPSCKGSCSKECYDPAKVGSKSDSEVTETKQLEEDSCIKECCESKACMKAPVTITEKCLKGCCGSDKAKPISIPDPGSHKDCHDHDHSEFHESVESGPVDVKPVAAVGATGCCGGDISGIQKHDHSHSHSHHGGSTTTTTSHTHDHPHNESHSGSICAKSDQKCGNDHKTPQANYDIHTTFPDHSHAHSDST